MRSAFEQEKFNLLREENEGYSKLIVMLLQPTILEVGEEDLKMLGTNMK
jgi:hypothetical protein